MESFQKTINEYNRQGRYVEVIKLIENKLQNIRLPERFYIEVQLAEALYSNREFNKSKSLTEELLIRAKQQQLEKVIGDLENLLGKIYRIHQHYDSALIHYKNAEKAFKSVKDCTGLSKVYHNLGNLYVFLEQFKKAKRYHIKALEFILEIGNLNAIASSYMNLGSLHYQNGEVDPALNYFHKALELFEQTEDNPNLAATYLNLAETYYLRNEYEKSRFNISRAKDLYTNQNNEIGIKLALTCSAKIYQAVGDFKNAIQEYKHIITFNPDDSPENIYLELGKCFLFEKQFELAQSTFEKILTLPDGSLKGLGFALDSLARISIESKDFKTAEGFYKQLLEKLNSTRIKDPQSVAAVQGNLGFMYLKNGNFSQARNLLEQASLYFKKKKIFDEYEILITNYYNEFLRIKQFNKAINLLNKHLIPIAKKTKNQEKENQYYCDLSFLFYIQGVTKESFKIMEKNSINVQYDKSLVCSFLDYPDFDPKTKKELEQLWIGFLKNFKKDH